jgi:DNA-binding transcriptional ArsR family regulator
VPTGSALVEGSITFNRFLNRNGGRWRAESIALDSFIQSCNQVVMELHGHMSSAPSLDAVFAALADPTRRAILLRLSAGEASVNDLAAPFKMSQPAVSKHLKVLERAGLVERDIDRQRRPARLRAAPLADAANWLEEFRRFWPSRFDQLDHLLEDLKEALAKGSQND